MENIIYFVRKILLKGFFSGTCYRQTESYTVRHTDNQADENIERQEENIERQEENIERQDENIERHKILNQK